MDDADNRHSTSPTRRQREEERRVNQRHAAEPLAAMQRLGSNQPATDAELAAAADTMPAEKHAAREIAASRHLHQAGGNTVAAALWTAPLRSAALRLAPLRLARERSALRRSMRGLAHPASRSRRKAFQAATSCFRKRRCSS
jgi:hypothetical protein